MRTSTVIVRNTEIVLFQTFMKAVKDNFSVFIFSLAAFVTIEL